jgi:hypothetical protein
MPFDEAMRHDTGGAVHIAGEVSNELGTLIQRREPEQQVPDVDFIPR